MLLLLDSQINGQRSLNPYLTPSISHPSLSFHKPKVTTKYSNSSPSSFLRHLIMHGFSPATATATVTPDASLCHLHSPDLAVSPPLFPSFPNFLSSHSSSSSLLLTYSQLSLGSELDSVLEPPSFLPSEVSYSGSSGPCSSYGSPTSQPALIQRSMSSHSLQKNRVSYGPGVAISSFFDVEVPAVRRVYSSGDLQVSFASSSKLAAKC